MGKIGNDLTNQSYRVVCVQKMYLRLFQFPLLLHMRVTSVETTGLFETRATSMASCIGLYVSSLALILFFCFLLLFYLFGISLLFVCFCGYVKVYFLSFLDVSR